ncbi:jacalin-like lectin domain-containing protein [Phanerochaete sordida]|uniref:Jacalin-like lectin domain-containing protein n=1 Tax=Phanerochaete sordida TaxID=48140 RepID=A0A9P3LEF9_9APHY|nr:jacalin-like lectin domain-containing protein [Phanerochaete sordida]
MPLPLRSTTLTAAVYGNGIRVHTKTSEGFVREVGNDTTRKQFADAMRRGDVGVVNHSDGWFTGDAAFQCNPESALCSFGWGDSSLSVFCQDEFGNIRERRFSGALGWELTDFVEENTLMGTNIAVVYSADASRVVLFFQDADGDICARTAHNGVFELSSVAIGRGPLGCGIGATAWDDLREIRLYFQDEFFRICEYQGTFGGKFQNLGTQFPFVYDYCVGDITAVSWNEGAQIRLYIQDKYNSIVEWAHSYQKWTQGTFKAAALPNADIIAFVRDSYPVPGYSLFVIWAGQDQKLYQSVWSTLQTGWSAPHEIASVRSTGNVVGQFVGDYFSDEDENTDRKAITLVQVCVNGGAVVGLALAYTDQTTTGWHGSGLGTVHEFALADTEDITTISYVEDAERLLGLSFTTSKGNQSPWYGAQGLESNTLTWTFGGHALGGFYGTADSVLRGLAPIWTTRIRGIDAGRLAELLRRALALAASVRESDAVFGALRVRADAYRTRPRAGLGEAAAKVMDGVVGTARSIEYLYDLETAHRRARLGPDADRRSNLRAQTGIAKTSADEVEFALKRLSEEYTAIHSEGNSLAHDVDAAYTRVQRDTTALQIFFAQIVTTIRDIEATMESLATSIALSEDEEADARAKEQKQRALTERAAKADLLNVSRYNRLLESAQKDLGEATKRTADFKAQQARLADDKDKLRAFRAEAEAALARIEATRVSLHVLISDEKASQLSSAALSESLAAIYKSTIPLDDHTKARGFAAALLAVIRHALSIELLRTQLRFDAAKLELVLSDIANSAY